MPGIKVKESESFDEAYRRFKKQCDRSLIVTETKINARKKMLKKLYMLRRYESRL
ncbi:MAG: 30S ribosomal protein S21 [Arcobacter sp.]|nr:MAG: 30S ribosomal protein S21 [Arcobacter sp.]